jgi:nucleoside-diphosphate-sugar epimerase
VTTLVLGGTGFIGSRIVQKLAGLGEQVVCLDIVPEASTLHILGDKVKILRGDITEIEEILKTMKSYRVSRLVHLAAMLNTSSGRDCHSAIAVNALGCSNVFEAARLFDVERVVYASSIAVYGEQSRYGDRPITEEDAVSPSSLYGAAKLLNEYEASLYCQDFGLSIVGIRIGIVAGHGRVRGQGMWAAEFASNPAVGKPANLPFDEEMRASLIYVDDVAELFVRVLQAPSPKHGIYNSGGENVSLGELVLRVRELIPHAKHTFGAERVPLAYIVDGTRAEKEFGWKRRSLRDHLIEHIGAARQTQA